MLLNKKDLRMLSLQKLIIGVLTLLGVLIVGVSPAFSQGAVDPASVRIPSQYGIVEEIWAPRGAADSIVIVFGERHALIESRENIARILEYLCQEYQISFVGLEGNRKGEQVDTSSFRELPEFEGLEGLKSQMSWALLDNGDINPYEYMGITYDIPIYGVEDWGLYSRDLQMHKSIDWEALATESDRLLIQVVNALLNKLNEELHTKHPQAGLERLNTVISQYNNCMIQFDAFLQYIFDIDRDNGNVFGEFKKVWEEFNTPLAGIKTQKAFYAYLRSEYNRDFSSQEMPEITHYDQYLDIAEDRGRAMADNLVSLIGRVGGDIVILGVGAGHTEVLQELKKKNVPYIFVLPKGLSTVTTEWEEEAYDDTLEGAPLSHGFSEWLQQKLMGQTRVDKAWFKTETETLYTALVARYLQENGVPYVGKVVDAAFKGYDRSYKPIWTDMKNIDEDLYLPFRADGQAFVVRVTKDEVDYTENPVSPILAHGQITRQDFYQVIAYEAWKDRTRMQQIIDQFAAQHPDKKLTKQFQAVLQSGRSVEEVRRALENLSRGSTEEFDGASIFRTGMDVYGFYQDKKSSERHFVRLTQETFRAWAEPNDYIVEHSLLGEGWRYEKLDFEPFVGELSVDVKKALFRNQVLLAKLDARLRHLTPSILVLSTVVNGKRTYLVTVGEGDALKVRELGDDVSAILTKIRAKVEEHPELRAKELIEGLAPEERQLVRNRLILPLVSHLNIDRVEPDRILLDLENEYSDFVMLDLPNDPVLRRIIPYFLRGNHVVGVSEHSTSRDVKRKLQATINVSKLRIVFSLPWSKVDKLSAPDKARIIQQYRDGIKQLRNGVSALDPELIPEEVIVDLSDLSPRDARRKLDEFLAEKESLVLSFWEAISPQELEIGRGGRFAQADIPEALRLTPERLLAYIGCRSFVAAWPDVTVDKQGVLSLTLWEEFSIGDSFRFVKKLEDILEESAGSAPPAIQTLLDILEELNLPGMPVVVAPSQDIAG